MSFLAPLFLALSALAIPIVILYMLKLRRRETEVSSTMLWRMVLRDREANAPWQRLRRNLLLLLQLLLLALLVRWLGGERQVWSVVHVPSAEAEAQCQLRPEIATSTCRQLVCDHRSHRDGPGPSPLQRRAGRLHAELPTADRRRLPVRSTVGDLTQ